MTTEKPKLDAATIKLAQRLLKMPPKHNTDLKVGQHGEGKKQDHPKTPASSSKPRNA